MNSALMTPVFKLKIFVAGDELMIALMRIFEVYDGKIPEDSSNFIIELHNDHVDVRFNDLPTNMCSN
jgi:hypothetical protein